MQEIEEHVPFALRMERPLLPPCREEARMSQTVRRITMVGALVAGSLLTSGCYGYDAYFWKRDYTVRDTIPAIGLSYYGGVGYPYRPVVHRNYFARWARRPRVYGSVPYGGGIYSGARHGTVSAGYDSW
jgi:hypothetical protein